MSEPTPSNAILASSSINQPGVIDHLNTILEDAGLGRALGPPENLTRAAVVLPVSADPGEVVAALRRVPGGSDHNPETPSTYSVDTIEDSSSHGDLVATMPFFQASGLKTGHGTISWEVVAPRAMPPDPPPWPPAGTPPVVVILDSGVKPHSWFPQTTHPSFLIDPPDMGPLFTVPMMADPALATGDFGAYWGHATFLAGLIRLHAPAAQVMSVKLMNDAGILDDRDILPALESLSRYIHDGGLVDVVLMAFGRPKQPGEADPDSLKDAIAALAGQHVRFVASAGNAHSDTETLPACLARHPDSPVVSVGAGISAKDREWYSNYGPWVRRWRPGTVVSVMPLAGPNEDPNGFALWSGTSFSAAILAGELAQERADEREASAGS